MSLESDGYKHHCGLCGAIWFHLDDYCPECGSSDVLEGHLIECDCEQCKEIEKDNLVIDCIKGKHDNLECGCPSCKK